MFCLPFISIQQYSAIRTSFKKDFSIGQREIAEQIKAQKPKEYFVYFEAFAMPSCAGRSAVPLKKILGSWFKIKTAHRRFDVRLYRILIFRLCRRIWHLNFHQVAGFHRAVPSTALDKACMQLLGDYINFFRFVNRICLFSSTKFTIRIWTFLGKADKINTISPKE